MKIFLLIAVLFTSQCFSQDGNEIGINMGFHTNVNSNYQRSLYGIVYEKETGVKNTAKETNFYFKLSYSRVLKEYLNVGTGGIYNSVNGFTNISPFINGKILYPGKPVHPYINGSIGINFMKYEGHYFFPGIFYEIGSGLNIDITKKVYIDVGLSFSYLDSNESDWVGKKVTKSVIQKFYNVNAILGLFYKIR